MIDSCKTSIANKSVSQMFKIDLWEFYQSSVRAAEKPFGGSFQTDGLAKMTDSQAWWFTWKPEPTTKTHLEALSLVFWLLESYPDLGITWTDFLDKSTKTQNVDMESAKRVAVVSTWSDILTCVLWLCEPWLSHDPKNMPKPPLIHLIYSTIFFLVYVLFWASIFLTL